MEQGFTTFASLNDTLPQMNSSFNPRQRASRDGAHCLSNAPIGNQKLKRACISIVRDPRAPRASPKVVSVTVESTFVKSRWLKRL